MKELIQNAKKFSLQPQKKDFLIQVNLYEIMFLLFCICSENILIQLKVYGIMIFLIARQGNWIDFKCQNKST